MKCDDIFVSTSDSGLTSFVYVKLGFLVKYQVLNIFPEYSVFWCDRKFDNINKICGGVLLACRASYNVVQVDLSRIISLVPRIDVGVKCIFDTFSVFKYIVYVPPSTPVRNVS